MNLIRVGSSSVGGAICAHALTSKVPRPGRMEAWHSPGTSGRSRGRGCASISCGPTTSTRCMRSSPIPRSAAISSTNRVRRSACAKCWRGMPRPRGSPSPRISSSRRSATRPGSSSARCTSSSRASRTRPPRSAGCSTRGPRAGATRGRRPRCSSTSRSASWACIACTPSSIPATTRRWPSACGSDAPRGALPRAHVVQGRLGRHRDLRDPRAGVAGLTPVLPCSLPGFLRGPRATARTPPAPARRPGAPRGARGRGRCARRGGRRRHPRRRLR